MRGRTPAIPEARIGPTAWVRFLARHFGVDLSHGNEARELLIQLGDQLSIPRVPGETFQPFVEPAPPRRRSRVLLRVLEKGSNPDGTYVQEVYGDPKRFNLYERVGERVPEARQWLLKDLSPFLEAEPPPIDWSLTTRNRLLQEMGLFRLDVKCELGWPEEEASLLHSAEADSLCSLTCARMPAVVALAMTQLHVCAWERDRDPRLVRALHRAAEGASRHFANTAWGLRLLDSPDALVLEFRLKHAARELVDHGMRTPLSSGLTEIDGPARRFVLLPDTYSLRTASALLHRGGHFGFEMQIRDFLEGRPKYWPDSRSMRDACLCLREGAAHTRRYLLNLARHNRARHQCANTRQLGLRPFRKSHILGG